MVRKSPPVVTGKKTSKSCPKPFQTITHSVPSASVIFEILKVSITVLQTRILLLTFLPNQVLLLPLTRNLGLLIQPPLIAFEAFVLSHCCETLQLSEKLCLLDCYCYLLVFKPPAINLLLFLFLLTLSNHETNDACLDQSYKGSCSSKHPTMSSRPAVSHGMLLL